MATMATTEKGELSMARIGKIARLPRDIRSQLNTRLQDGHEGKKILLWLNSLPQVKALLAEFCDGCPVNEQNLSDWRQGGFEEWLLHQDLLAQAAELAANHHELQSAALGQSLTDHLATAVSYRYATLLASQGPQFDEPALRQLRSLGRTCQAVVKLSRRDQNAARLKIETERWQLARAQIETDRADVLDHKLRDKLAAPVWAALKKAERLQQFGGGEGAMMAADMLQEIETCDDPAHFQSKTLAALSLPELRRKYEELAKHPPVKPSPVQAAADMLKEMDACLAETEIKIPDLPPPSGPRRRARKPTRHPSARHVHRVHPVHKVHAPCPPKPSLERSSQASPPPPLQANPQSAICNPQLPEPSNLSARVKAVVPPCSSEPAIQANQG
jgi:hypothetical protein